LIHHVLTHAGLQGTQSPKSFNNHLGVPLTLLSAKPDHDFVACEIGTNHPGEIDFLGAIARPDIAVITSIGEEHLKFFGDINGVAEEEFSIVRHLADEHTVVTGNLGSFSDRLAADPEVNDIPAVSCGYTPPSDMPLVGEHNRINALMAWCIARWIGLVGEQCDKALRTVAPAKHRGEIIRLAQGVLIYDDCYNANPSSIRAAIDTLRAMPCDGKRVAVLGDMLELGEHSHALHTDIGRYAMGDGDVYPFLIGEHFSKIGFDMFVRPPQLQWSDELPDSVAQFIEPGDTVLLKASRGMRLERLIPAIERRFGKAE
ncbi:MAG: Mur ligase family protein, partial [Planctomycetota bacterium]